jgi:hypothetical protein
MEPTSSTKTNIPLRCGSDSFDRIDGIWRNEELSITDEHCHTQKKDIALFSPPQVSPPNPILFPSPSSSESGGAPSLVALPLPPSLAVLPPSLAAPLLHPSLSQPEAAAAACRRVAAEQAGRRRRLLCAGEWWRSRQAAAAGQADRRQRWGKQAVGAGQARRHRCKHASGLIVRYGSGLEKA